MPPAPLYLWTLWRYTNVVIIIIMIIIITKLYPTVLQPHLRDMHSHSKHLTEPTKLHYRIKLHKNMTSVFRSKGNCLIQKYENTCQVHSQRSNIIKIQILLGLSRRIFTPSYTNF